VANRGHWKHDVPNEIWSLGGISQRLFAGAMGSGFIPTKSMMDTTIAEDNKECFKVIDDPFGSGKKIGVIKALKPRPFHHPRFMPLTATSEVPFRLDLTAYLLSGKRLLACGMIQQYACERLADGEVRTRERCS